MNIFRRRDRAEAEIQPSQGGSTGGQPMSHLERLYKLSAIDDLVKNYGPGDNKPKSQRGGSTTLMPNLPNPPRSSRNDKATK